MKTYAYKLGAIFYVLWGMLHLIGAGVLLLQATTEGGTSALTTIGSNLPAAEIPTISDGLTTTVLAYYAWNLISIGVLVIIIGGWLNWKNDRAGYWLNLILVSAIDGGLIIMLILPGYMALADGMLGVVLWIPALILSTLGLLVNDTKPVGQVTVA